MRWYMLFIITVILTFLNIVTARAEDDIALLNAIYKAEGGAKATYLYGIRSVTYNTPAEARQICLNTIRNNRRRFKEYGHKTHKTYLEFLASRYAPINAKNDPSGLNHNWLRNVRYFLKKGGL